MKDVVQKIAFFFGAIAFIIFVKLTALRMKIDKNYKGW